MLTFLLNFLFPQKPLVQELERVSPEEFSSRASPNKAPIGADIQALFEYADPYVRAAIWQLKYSGNKKIARLLSDCLYDEILAFLEEYAPLAYFTDPILIPIPLSKKRERGRGFNQCQLISDRLCEIDQGRHFKGVPEALKKIKETASQTKSENRQARIKNLEGCFRAEPPLVSGRNIILIDDVTTTGATLEEARKALKAGGARKVIAFAIAH